MVTERYLVASDQFDPGREFIRAVPTLVERARIAATTEAKSHRDVHVGAAGYAVNLPNADSGIYVAGNIKPNRHITTQCAEKLMLEKARKAGFTVVAGIVVASTLNNEEIESIVEARPATLPPCSPCTSYFVDSPLMREDTPIVTVAVGDDRRQVHLNAELRANYIDGDLTELEKAPVRFGFDNWDRRVDIYDTLLRAEHELAAEERRSIGKLVQLSLLAKTQ